MKIAGRARRCRRTRRRTRRRRVPRLRGKACLWTKAEARNRKIRRRRMLPGPGGSAAAQSVKKCRPADPPIPPEDMIPLSTGQCVGILLALCVPVLNLVLMLKWAYAARGNESRRSLARAGLILTGVCIGASIVVLAAVTFAVSMGLVSVGGVV